MYLPALTNHPDAEVVAVCGRNLERAQAFADTWSIPKVYTDIDVLLDAGVDALVIASANKSHYPYTMKALARGVHVLCEKPLALTFAEAREMTELARARGVKHMVPFTYAFMPTNRYLKQLIDEGYIGTPYHMNLRYYTGFARGGDYLWRFDVGEAGSGVAGDIGSHWLYLARMFYGEIKAITCLLGYNVARAPRPDGKAYEQAEDSAMMLLEFVSGAQASLHVTAVCYEDTPFGQTHHMEFHGSGGTLYSYTDWDTVQEVRGARMGEGVPRRLEIPEAVWGSVRRDSVHNTYKDIFRQEDYMARGFISAIVNDTEPSPSFVDGLRIQQLTDAAILSAKEGRRVEVAPADVTS